MTICNEHLPTDAMRQRISDLVIAGTPMYLIADVLDLDDETIKKHYRKEIATAKAIAIERIAKTVYQQAVEGDSKAQALYLKTQGASQGWVEKQVVENVNNDETLELKARVLELEGKFEKDY